MHLRYFVMICTQVIMDKKVTEKLMKIARVEVVNR